MVNYQKELDTVLQLKETGGFHYTHQVQTLVKKAKTARHWTSLLRTPPHQWHAVLRDTRYILDQLDN